MSNKQRTLVSRETKRGSTFELLKGSLSGVVVVEEVLVLHGEERLASYRTRRFNFLIIIFVVDDITTFHLHRNSSESHYLPPVSKTVVQKQRVFGSLVKFPTFWYF